MNAVIDQLYILQQLEFPKKSKAPDAEAKIQELRATIPPAILGHYDRLLQREKKGVAIVRNSVCSECHMKVAIGIVATLARREDIQLCGNCGRYLYLPADEPVNVPAPEAKPAPKRRKSRAAVSAE